jgi:hypothetical protein
MSNLLKIITVLTYIVALLWNFFYSIWPDKVSFQRMVAVDLIAILFMVEDIWSDKFMKDDEDGEQE